MKSNLTPEGGRDLYNGVTDPREELLGDTLELALGVLTLAARFPNHFINWGGSEGASACVRGLDRSIWRYAAAEVIELITAESPRKRSPPRRDGEIVNFLNSMTEGLSVEFEAVVDGDSYRPGVGSNDEPAEVATAPPMPDETAEAESGQPEAEDDSSDPNHEIHMKAKEQVMSNLEDLADGTVRIGDRVLTRRPKANVRPRRATLIADVILTRYDNPRNLRSDVTSRTGQFLMCGVEIAEIGPVSQEGVCQMIEDASDHRDRCLPQRGDRPKYVINADTGDYDNKGYACMSDNVKGGILDLMPIEGARFTRSRWNLVDTCRPRDMARRAINNASWALRCIQMDLRHHISRLGGTTYLDGRSNTRFHDVIRCDKGGWVHIEDLVKMEVLWTAQSRQITTTASHTAEDQKKRTYNERVQLLINGNLLEQDSEMESSVFSSLVSG
eukprot:s920_g15.t1